MSSIMEVCMCLEAQQAVRFHGAAWRLGDLVIGLVAGLRKI